MKHGKRMGGATSDGQWERNTSDKEWQMGIGNGRPTKLVTESQWAEGPLDRSGHRLIDDAPSAIGKAA